MGQYKNLYKFIKTYTQDEKYVEYFMDIELGDTMFQLQLIPFVDVKKLYRCLWEYRNTKVKHLVIHSTYV